MAGRSGVAALVAASLVCRAPAGNLAASVLVLALVGCHVSDFESEPVSRLRWYPDRGFELDLNASVDDVILTLVAVPLPADGTVELRSGDLRLDPLEILFKAQVDLDGVPGQLTQAVIRIVADGSGGERVELEAEVEDAETGDRRDVAVAASLVMPSNAPESGGPRPRPKDESELDWDDEDTIEAYFKDPLTQEDPLPVAERRISKPNADAPSEPDGSKQERGFNRLLQALLNEHEHDDEGDTFDLDDQDVDDEPVAEVIPLVRDPADARGLLRYLFENEQIELEEGYQVDGLVAGAAPILASSKPPEACAKALSEWLFTQEAVAEVFIDDDDLAALIAQW
jgi:hypothetical protein